MQRNELRKKLHLPKCKSPQVQAPLSPLLEVLILPEMAKILILMIMLNNNKPQHPMY